MTHLPVAGGLVRRYITVESSNVSTKPMTETIVSITDHVFNV